MEQTELSRLYVEYKSLLFSLAYKMTGSVADAEDVVQDVFIKLNGYEVMHIRNIKAFLCKMVSNRCIDLLKSSRNRRELYVGMWLPEPLTFIEKEPLQEIMVKSDISMLCSYYSNSLIQLKERSLSFVKSWDMIMKQLLKLYKRRKIIVGKF